MSVVVSYIVKCFEKGFLDHVVDRYVVMVRRGLVCFIPHDLDLSIVDFGDIVVSGIIVGWVKRGVFIPSTNLFLMAKEAGYRFGCSVIASEQGVKAFLYGNDLLLESFRGFLEPVHRGMYVAVLDHSDLHPIGIGRLVIDPKDIDKLVRDGRNLEVVVENVFDLGRLLRDRSLFKL